MLQEGLFFFPSQKGGLFTVFFGGGGEGRKGHTLANGPWIRMGFLGRF